MGRYFFSRIRTTRTSYSLVLTVYSKMKVALFIFSTLVCFCFSQTAAKNTKDVANASSAIRAAISNMIAKAVTPYMKHDEDWKNFDITLPFQIGHIVRVTIDDTHTTETVDLAWITAGKADSLNLMFKRNGNEFSTSQAYDITFSNKKFLTKYVRYQHLTKDQSMTFIFNKDLSGSYHLTVADTMDAYNVDFDLKVDASAESVRTNDIITFEWNWKLNNTIPATETYMHGTHTAEITTILTMDKSCEKGVRFCKSFSASAEGTWDGKKFDRSGAYTKSGSALTVNLENYITKKHASIELTGDADQLKDNDYFSLNFENWNMDEPKLLLMFPSNSTCRHRLRLLGKILLMPHAKLYAKIMYMGNPKLSVARRRAEQIIIIASHLDRLFAMTKGKTIFGVSRIIEASKIESEILFDRISACPNVAANLTKHFNIDLADETDLNGLLQSMAHSVNNRIIFDLNTFGSPKVVNARNYFNKITGPRGNKKFNGRMNSIKRFMNHYFTEKNEMTEDEAIGMIKAQKKRSRRFH